MGCTRPTFYSWGGRNPRSLLSLLCQTTPDLLAARQGQRPCIRPDQRLPERPQGRQINRHQQRRHHARRSARPCARLLDQRQNRSQSKGRARPEPTYRDPKTRTAGAATAKNLPFSSSIQVPGNSLLFNYFRGKSAQRTRPSRGRAALQNTCATAHLALGNAQISSDRRYI